MTDRFVSRTMRLTYLSPDVLERLLLMRMAPSVSVKDLINATYRPWAEQMERVFDERSIREPSSTNDRSRRESTSASP